MDTPPARKFVEYIPPEIDVASPLRRFVALTLTGNPEAGFQTGKDIVLPPTHWLKGGPTARDRCCSTKRPRRLSPPLCKERPRVLQDSPWKTAPSFSSHAPYLLRWAGQASGNGMGRHGGSGPRARKWLATVVARTWPDALITDTNNYAHRKRNVRTLPATAIYSTDPMSPRFGYLRPGLRATFCAAPFGRGNGWEGRSATAVRDGSCLPLLLHPPRTQMPLEPFVPWDRFTIRIPESSLAESTAMSLHQRLKGISEHELQRMRCEMACAATHMTYGGAVPSASCAFATVTPERTGVVATLVTILANRRTPANEQMHPRPCPCTNESVDWHYFPMLRAF